ncbi:MAG: hypothetical protein EA388_09780 [Nitriliruptor sp.]|nr:MAG: hypothetical protein EA388_09780 [Nitriliruptor sp.]
MRITRSAGQRCRSCAATWDDATARYCGRCGAQLPGRVRAASARHHRTTTARWTGGPGRPAALALSLLAVAVVVGGAATVLSAGEPAPTGEREVVLPAPEELPAPGSPDQPLAAGPALPAASACEPDGCALWEAATGPGEVTVTSQRTVYHVQPTELTRLDASDGRIEWRRSLLDREGADATGHPAVFPLDHDLLLLAFGRRGEVEFRWTGDGKLLWQTQVHASFVSSARLVGGVVVIAGASAEGRRADGPPASSFVTGIDRETREVLWRREVDTLVGEAGALTLVRDLGGRLAGLDAATGEPRWSMGVDPAAAILPGERFVVVAGSRSIGVIDGQTGDRSHTIDRPAGADGRVERYGELLTIRAGTGIDPSSRSRADLMTVDVTRAEAPVERFPRAGGVVHLEDGLVIVTQQGAALDLHRLDAQGREVWAREIELADPTCCWRIEPSAMTDALVVVPPRPDREPIRVLSTQDGTTRSSFRLSAELRENPDLRWIGPVAMRFDEQHTILAGPAGEVRLPGRATVVSAQDPLLLATTDGLVAIDERWVTLSD